jgi:hypothetical protein
MRWFSAGWKRVTFCGMQNQPEESPIKSLRDAYQVAGFRAQAKLDSYDHEPPAFVLTLARRSKKPCVAVAEHHVAAATTIAGAGRAILVAAIGKSISIFKCAASVARSVG